MSENLLLDNKQQNSCVSESQVIDRILKWCAGRNRTLDNLLLDLRAALIEKEEPVFCLDTYFQIKDAIHPDNRAFLLIPLENLLCQQIVMQSYNTKTKYIEHFRIALDYLDLPSLFCAFRRAYHQVGSCFLCPTDPEFRLVFLNKRNDDGYSQ